MNIARSGRMVVLLGVVLGLVGLVAEWIAWRNRLMVGLPHWAVGCALVASGCIAWVRVPWSHVGRLLVAAGAAWSISALGDGATDTGRLATACSFLYVGVLLHALCAYPSGRLLETHERGVVVCGYVLSAAGPLWRSDTGLIIAGTLIGTATVAVWRHRTPVRRRDAAPAMYLAVLVALSFLVIPGVRVAASELAHATGIARWDTGALMASVVALLVGFGLTWSLIRLDQRRITMTDLVIELGEGGSSGLVAELRRALGDPDLTVGIWRPGAGRFEDEQGEPVTVPAMGGTGVALIEDNGEQVAVVLHDPSLADDPGLRAVLVQSARMAARNAALRLELGAQAEQLDASRRRLLEAADAQRRLLFERLRRGPMARLERAASQVGRLPHRGSSLADAPSRHLLLAADHLAHARHELDDIGRGLDPGSLTSRGIGAALLELAARNPVPVMSTVPSSLPVSGLVASTLYFTASESLTNVTRHAHASDAWLEVSVVGDRVRLIVEDDGTGGADLGRGTGLRGLRDRLEVLGGTLTVQPRPGGGTRVLAEVPLTPRLGTDPPAPGVMVAHGSAPGAATR